MTHIFRSPMTKRYYFASKVRDLGNGNFRIIGKKIDITADIEAIIDQHERDCNQPKIRNAL